MQRLTLPLAARLACAVEGAKISVNIASVCFGSESVSWHWDAGRLAFAVVLGVVDSAVRSVPIVSM